MNSLMQKQNYKQHVLILVGLFVCIVTIYSNSLHNAFQFDDSQFVDHRPNLHVTELSFDSLKNTFYWDTADKKLRRPIPFLSLGLNYYFGRLDPLGYHIVNITIHFFCACAVYWFIILLLGIPSVRPIWFHQHRNEIAALTCFLFALHPLQTNVATYIIQRITSLAALFFLLSTCGFIIFRKSIGERKGKHRLSLFFSFLLMCSSGAAAIFSKENTAVLPIIMITIDFLFFYPQGNKNEKRATLLIYFFLLFLPFIAAFILSPDTVKNLFNPQKLISSFDYRSFTLGERLLTEPRIVLFYLFLIFVPRLDLLNINHDFNVSTSLLTPPQTILSILAITILILLSFRWYKKYNLISFCILWYFIGLSVESTFIALELTFEHRTYLPGVTVFLLIAAMLYFFATTYLRKPVAALFLSSILILYGNGTYLRNFTWATPVTLWYDVTQKSPNLSRAFSTYGESLYNEGRYQEARIPLERSVLLDPNRIEALHTLSKLLNEHLNKPEQAMALALKSYQIAPGRFLSCMTLADAYYFQKKYVPAEKYYKETLKRYHFFLPAYNNLALCQIFNQKNKEAIKTFEQALSLDSSFEVGIMNLARLYKKNGDTDKAKRVLEKYMKINPHSHKLKELYNFLDIQQLPPQTKNIPNVESNNRHATQ